MKVKLLLIRKGWQHSSCGRLHLLGTLFYQQQQLTVEQLVVVVEKLTEPQDLQRFLFTCSGFFSLVVKLDHVSVLISDLVRSYPLFFANQHNEMVVSDEAEAIAALFSLSEINTVHAAEFLRLGYVLAPDSLFTSVQQVPAGSFYWQSETAQFIQQYYVWQRQHVAGVNEAVLLDQLDHMLQAAVQQLLQIADGRQIVLPLSGGYDSRALLLCLKKLGSPNVVTFTFGARGSAELVQASLLAKQLQIPWFPVVYDAALWQQLRHDDEFGQYCQFVCNAVSVPNVQVWPAVRQLVQQRVIEADAILVPGHTGDFISGGHLSGNIAPVKQLADVERVVSYLAKKHYCLDKEPLSVDVRSRLQASCARLWQSSDGWTCETLAEAWNWQYRQSQFVVNSNRYYEFFGLSVWMPLWQREFIDFWRQVPLEFLREQNLWRRYIQLQSSELGITVPVQNAGKLKQRFNRVRLALNYFFDRNLLVRLIPFSSWLLYRIGLRKHSGTLFSYLARVRLKEMYLKTKV